MKTTLSLILSMITVLASASQPDLKHLYSPEVDEKSPLHFVSSIANCRDAYLPASPEVPFSHQIEMDLISGQWEQSNLRVYFNEDGTSDWLSEKQNGEWSYQEKKWTMSGTPDMPLLEIKQENGATEQYFVEPTCQGVMLQKTATTETLQLDYHPMNLPHPQKGLQKELNGSWEHLLSPAQVEELQVLEASNILHQQAWVRLHFSPNGIFTKELIAPDADIHIRETGTWKVSRDGQFILLNNLHGVQRADSRCIRLKYIELDELVLEQPLAFVDVKGTLARQDFYFNKH